MKMNDCDEKAITVMEHFCKPMDPIQRVISISLIKMPNQDDPVWFHGYSYGDRPTQLHAIFHCPYCGVKLSEEGLK